MIVKLSCSHANIPATGCVFTGPLQLFSAYFRVKAEKALDALLVSHHHRGGRVVAEDTLKKMFLCNCCSEISILAAEKTQAIGELCTCGNLPHTCQEGQHTHGKQKLLYLSYTQKRVMLPHSATTPAIYHNGANKTPRTLCVALRGWIIIMDKCVCLCVCMPMGFMVLFWRSHTLCCPQSKPFSWEATELELIEHTHAVRDKLN